jgi:hypothetical protein
VPEEAAGVLDGEITTDDIQALKEVDLDTATPNAVAAIVEALDEAPEEVKEEFEAEVNVFEGSFDSYTATGSNVTVGERRTVVAATVVVSFVPVTRRRVR